MWVVKKILSAQKLLSTSERNVDASDRIVSYDDEKGYVYFIDNILVS